MTPRALLGPVTTVRRVAPALQYAGVVGAVFGLSKLHALAHGYDFTGSSRLGWAVAYTVLLGLATYSAGLPDLASDRSTIATAAGRDGGCRDRDVAVPARGGIGAAARGSPIFGAAAVLVPVVGVRQPRSRARRRTRRRRSRSGRLRRHPGRRRDAHRRSAARPERPAVLARPLEPANARPYRAR